MSASLRRHEGAIVFAVALLARLLVGALIYGSIDLTNSLGFSIQLHEGQKIILPYLPLVPLLIWTGGALGGTTSIPLALCFKLVPILCDSLLAWLLYEWLGHKAGRQGRIAGLLYALSPVPLIVASIHSQWDPIPLFFLACAIALRDSAEESARRDLALGAVFGLACVAKPYPLMLAPVLLLPPLIRLRGERGLYVKSALRTVAAAFAVLAIAIGLAALAGYDVQRQLAAIFYYSNDSIQIFGLPFAPGLEEVGFLRRHFWTLPVILALAAPYHLGRWPSVRAAAASFTFILAVSGLGPQYLMWPSALLLAAGFFWEAGAAGLLCTVFLTLYYMNPNASYVAWENMATFATVEGATWLMPTKELADPGNLSTIHVLGNIALPVLFLVILARLLIGKPQWEKPQGEKHGEPAGRTPAAFFEAAPVAVLVFIAALACAGAFETSKVTPIDLSRRLSSRLNHYAIQLGRQPHPIVGRYDEGGPLGLPRLLVALAVLTGAGCVAAGSRRFLRSPRS